MNEQIIKALTKQFEKHRIIFWYDAKMELRDDFEALILPGVKKLEILNNEYKLKYHILREEPDQRFLVYHEGPQPADLDNWLLDVQLAHYVFRTDQIAIWLSEFDLGLEFADLVQEHAEFFGSVKRKEAYRRLKRTDDTPGMIRLKMLSVCAACEPRMDAVAESLLQELSDARDDKFKLIGRVRLDGFLWEQMTRYFGYKSNDPSIRDFVVELFKSCYAMGTDGQVRLTGDALVFLKRWKDSRQFTSCFEKLSADCSEVLCIERDLATRDFRMLIELDYFRLIDQKIISELVRAVIARTVSSGDVTLWVRQRRQGHWYQEYTHLYESIDVAAQFIQTLSEANLDMDSLADGVQRYSRSWYQLDLLYRRFIVHMRRSGQASLMGILSEQIENLYSNNYLLKVNDRWQSFVDAAPKWDAAPVPLQRNFYDRWIVPFLNKDNKVFVIISDALRYEIGEELLSLVRQEERYSAELEPALSMLPSYTQLCMAAMLPNKELMIADNDTGTVLVNGQSTQGAACREKILKSGTPGKTAAVLSAEEFLGMQRDGDTGYRALFSMNDVVYIYHNVVDATGDKRDSEERVFEAVDAALEELVRIIRKLSTANVTNMIVTADHGFIYQHRAIEESDFSGSNVDGESILYRDRRFILGKGLCEGSGLHKFTSSQLGLSGQMEVLIPKSINRLRLKGSGSRFVHGGACLQEVVIPVLRINKKREDDLSVVEVDILRGASELITSGQLAAVFYQSKPVTDKVQARRLRAGLYTEKGDLISDSHELSFDLISENPRERELQVRFVLTRKADEANEQEVILKLEEKHAGTTHYKTYKSIQYKLRRSFTSDFDF